MKEFFDFSIYEYRLVEEFLRDRDVLKDTELLEFESANINDIIDIEIVDYKLKACEIIYDQEENESVVVKVNYDIFVNGKIVVFDPFESIYDDADEEYVYPIYKTKNELELNNLEVYLELFKDKNGDYKKYKIVDKAMINLIEYLFEMTLYYKE